MYFFQRDLEDLRGQLHSERKIVVSLREELSQLQLALEASNAASYEAQRRLATEEAAMQHEREAMQDAEQANADLRRQLAESEVANAEKERIVESQHRDIVKLRNQIGGCYVSTLLVVHWLYSSVKPT